MRVGDIVALEKDIIEREGHPPEAKSLGIVVDIHDWKCREGDFPEETAAFQKVWLEKLGRRIDVLWSNGSVTKSFAESGLRVVNEGR